MITRLTPGVLLSPDHRHELTFVIPITLLDMTMHYHGDWSRYVPFCTVTQSQTPQIFNTKIPWPMSVIIYNQRFFMAYNNVSSMSLYSTCYLYYFVELKFHNINIFLPSIFVISKELVSDISLDLSLRKLPLI